MSSGNGVVLLHGIFHTRYAMSLLERHLRKQGFSVLNLDYPSTRFPLDALADHIHPAVDSFAQALPGTLSFVGFSMGGLLTRAYIARYRPARLGKVVMLGTPNQGSEFADWLKPSRLYRWLYGPAGQQLVTDQSAFNHLFGPVDYALGVIAGEARFDPLAAHIFKTPNDGKVTVERTKLHGMADHITLPSSHTLMSFRPAIWRQVAHFLQQGRFRKD